MKPIIFSSNMVRAILDGRKTMTRRIIKPQPLPDASIGTYSFLGFINIRDENLVLGEELGGIDCTYANYRSSPYQAGDILWVREQWRVIDYEHIDGEWSASVQFRADMKRGIRLRWMEGDANTYERTGWRPSIHLPQKAARLFLRVVTVRAERLQDITEADAIQEGFGGIPFENPRPDACPWVVAPTLSFGIAWNKLNSKRGYGWDINPFVWVIEFERKNHDGNYVRN